jgi:DNA-directed RNA polymerase subunit RPC12/RpoP
MWYIAIIFFLIIGTIVSCNVKSKEIGKKEINQNNDNALINNPIDTIRPMYSKKNIEKKLKKLAETPPPEELSFGAMCYKVSGPPETASYICPACGNKTLHKIKQENENIYNNNGWKKIEAVIGGIAACRKEAEKIKGINFEIDESQFCKHCRPDIEEAQLCLKINISNSNDTTTVCDIDYLDVRLIKEFLNDELKHKDSYDGESPLVNHIYRIKELLGMN